MANENQSAIDKFLGDFGNREQIEDPFESKDDVDAFSGDANADPADEPIVEKKEKRLGFGEDPKVQRYVSKQVAEAIESFKASLPKQEAPKDEDTTSVVEAFTAIIGNDTPEKVAALKSLEKALGNVDDRASQKAIERLEELQSQSSQEDQQAEDELEEGFDAVEDHYDMTFTKGRRAAFAGYLERIAPKDQHGNVKDYPDFVNAYEDFMEREKRTQAPDRSRQVASRSMSRSSSADASQPQQRVSFDQADEFIESLKNY